MPPSSLLYSEALLVVRWDIWGRRRWDRGAWNLHPGAGQVQLDPHLDGGGGFGSALAESDDQSLLAQVFSSWSLFSFVLSSALSLCPCPRSLSGYLTLFVFFSGALPIVSRQYSLWWEAEHLETNGLQHSGVCGGWIRGQGPCTTSSWGSMTQPDLSTSAGLPPMPKRCRWVPTATVSCTQQPKRPEGPPSVPWPLGGDKPTEMIPLYINVGDEHQVYCCQVEGCPEGPSSSHATICSHVCCTPIWSQIWCVASVLAMYFKTNALRWHGEWTHCSGSLDPT